MASLKDMRVRIASTKATQKITKAMQMVAASKLRRAQTAAEAARPYAEKMDAVISNIASAAAGFARRPGAAGRHRQGSGASAAGLHRRARPFRRLQFVDRAPGARARSVAARPGQRGQDFLRRPQGLRAAPPNLREDRSSSTSTCARFASSASSMPKTLPKRFWRVSRPASSMSARCSIRASNP